MIMNYDSRVLGFNVKKYIEDLKLDMTGKWALRLVLIIESFGHARVDESGPIILFLSVRMAVILLRILRCTFDRLFYSA